MSKEQAKEFFKALSKDKQLAEELKKVLSGRATDQEKANELLSLANKHNFKFTEDELKRSLNQEDLEDIAGGSVRSLGGTLIASIFALGMGGQVTHAKDPYSQPETQSPQTSSSRQQRIETLQPQADHPRTNPRRESDLLRNQSGNDEFRERRNEEGVSVKFSNHTQRSQNQSSQISHTAKRMLHILREQNALDLEAAWAEFYQQLNLLQGNLQLLLDYQERGDYQDKAETIVDEIIKTIIATNENTPPDNLHSVKTSCKRLEENNKMCNKFFESIS